MKAGAFFIGGCLAVSLTIGCELDELTGSGGGSGGDQPVAERSAYTTIKSWDGRIAKLSDGFVLIIENGIGNVQRESCSWENTTDADFDNASKNGQLVFYRVYITPEFVPNEPMTANEFILVNQDCFKENPNTCGVPSV